MVAVGAIALGMAKSGSAQTTRPLQAGSLWLDDNHGHLVRLYIPEITGSTDSVFDWALPVPPSIVPPPESGFVYKGTVDGSILVWNSNVDGTGKGAWVESTDGFQGGGGVNGSGDYNMLARWDEGNTLTNGSIYDNGNGFVSIGSSYRPMGDIAFSIGAKNQFTVDTLGNVRSANSFYGSFNGSGYNLTNLDASQVAVGTLDDSRLSGNVALKNTTNNFAINYDGDRVASFTSQSATNSDEAVLVQHNGSGEGLHAITQSATALHGESGTGSGLVAASTGTDAIVGTTGAAHSYAANLTGSADSSNGVQINAGAGGQAINVVRGRFINSYTTIASGSTAPLDYMVVEVQDDGDDQNAATVSLPSDAENGTMITITTNDPNGLFYTDTEDYQPRYTFITWLKTGDTGNGNNGWKTNTLFPR